MNPTLRKWIGNRYVIASTVFVLFMFFGDKNNVLDQVKLHRQYAKVKTEHAYYRERIDDASREYNELFSNDRNLEKFAREKYLMKRDNEDVFVIVPAKPKPSESE